MTNIPQNANIVEGDTIITSGFGGIYPKGIPIGSVAAIKMILVDYYNMQLYTLV